MVGDELLDGLFVAVETVHHVGDDFAEGLVKLVFLLVGGGGCGGDGEELFVDLAFHFFILVHAGLFAVAFVGVFRGFAAGFESVYFAEIAVFSVVFSFAFSFVLNFVFSFDSILVTCYIILTHITILL